MAQKNTFLKGRFEGASDNDIVYVFSTSGIPDSCYIKNKKFQFALKATKQWEVFFIKYTNLSKTYNISLLLKEGSGIQLDVDKDLSKSKISGNELAEEQNFFYKGLNSYVQEYTSINNEVKFTIDSFKLVQLKQKLVNANYSIEKYKINWVKQHLSSPFSVAVLRLFLFKGSYNKEDTLAEKLFDLLLPQATNDNFEANLLRKYFQFFNDKYSFLPINTQAPIFNVKDSSGNEINLSDFKNDFILIDFWASWCGPCREVAPKLKEIFHKYKQAGLRLLSISLDTDAKKWKKAIIDGKMDWLQGSDFMGKNAGVGFKYGIFAIPQYVLLGPNNTVLMSNVSSSIEEIEIKLKEIFK